MATVEPGAEPAVVSLPDRDAAAAAPTTASTPTPPIASHARTLSPRPGALRRTRSIASGPGPAVGPGPTTDHGPPNGPDPVIGSDPSRVAGICTVAG